MTTNRKREIELPSGGKAIVRPLKAGEGIEFWQKFAGKEDDPETNMEMLARCLVTPEMTAEQINNEMDLDDYIVLVRAAAEVNGLAAARPFLRNKAPQ